MKPLKLIIYAALKEAEEKEMDVLETTELLANTIRKNTASVLNAALISLGVSSIHSQYAREFAKIEAALASMKARYRGSNGFKVGGVVFIDDPDMVEDTITKGESLNVPIIDIQNIPIFEKHTHKRKSSREI